MSTTASWKVATPAASGVLPDPPPISQRRRIQHLWGRGCVEAVASVVVAPQAIPLGGGLARSGSLLFEPVRQALDRHLGVVRRPRLLPATLRDEAGFLGAALLAWEVLDHGRAP
jgi:predicted NBD/HSP70 family sugar kinase